MNRRHIFLSGIATIAVTAAGILPAKADWIEDAVKDIRAKYNQIEGWKKRSETIKFESDQEPLFGTLTKYYSGETVVKIEFSYTAGDHGGADESYYYDNGQLMFIYTADSYWSFTGNVQPDGQSETKDTLIEQRLYFAKNQLIRHLRKSVESTNPEKLKSLVSKAENQPYQDPDTANRLFLRGLKLPFVSSGKEIEALMTSE